VRGSSPPPGGGRTIAQLPVASALMVSTGPGCPSNTRDVQTGTTISSLAITRRCSWRTTDIHSLLSVRGGECGSLQFHFGESGTLISQRERLTES